MSLFKRSYRSREDRDAAPPQQSSSAYKVDKGTRLKKSGSSRGDSAKVSKLQRSFSRHEEAAAAAAAAGGTQAAAAAAVAAANPVGSSSKGSLAPSPIITLTVGREGRLFAAHEDVLCQSSFFEAACREMYLGAPSKRIALPDEEPEIFSAILEYLYKGDYYPRLLHNKNRNSWELEDAVRTPQTSPQPNENPGGRAGPSAVEAVAYMSSTGTHVLRDTVVYCAAERYGLEELKRLALRKQGLQCGIDVGTILRSAQYAYAHTPDSDSRLRAHYLALIIRCRRTFKRSGTMQAEMEKGAAGGAEGGGKLFFDLFVAMCNHLDDVIEAGNRGTPRTI